MPSPAVIKFKGLSSHRSIRCIDCQGSTLGLRIDFTLLPSMRISIDVGIYAPSTSRGYLNLYHDDDVFIRDQVDGLIKETLLELIDILAFRTKSIVAMTDTMVILASEFESIKELLEFLPFEDT